MRGLAFSLRWSGRDLRSHLAKVLAIALVIAIGTGGYAGLTSTTAWRETSYARSYSLLAMYDLRIDLPVGGMAPSGDLDRIVAGMSDGRVTASEERLIVPIQVDASTGEQTVIVRGVLIGADHSGGGPSVARYHVLGGRAVDQRDAGAPVVMIEKTFADFYQLPDSGSISLSGGRRMDYVGVATTPEFFTVAPEGGMFMSEATYAAVFTTLETAQAVAGGAPAVNNLVLTLAAGTDRAGFARELEASLSDRAIGATVASRDDNLSYTALNNDIDQDQAMFDLLAVLLLVGAVGAAVNLISRMVQQQRREIGIGMALGVRPLVLAVRPLLVSAEIAVLGVVFGVGVGTLIGRGMGTVLRGAIPLPVWDTSFQPEAFVPVAIVGAVLPVLASALPVGRAVRVAPIAAIRPIHLHRVERGPTARRRHAVSTIALMPFHNLARDRRRTTLTLLGLAAAVAVMVGFLGVMDSVFHAIDTGERESTGDRPERITVGLDTFHLTGSPELSALAAAATVESVEPTLRLPVRLRRGDVEIDAFVELLDLRDGSWRPSITAGSLEQDRTGLIVTEKAARDLGISVGDPVVLHHPRREGLTSYVMVDTEVPVVATHPYPVRVAAFMDVSQAQLFGLEGIANGLNVYPVSGAEAGDVQRELFEFDFVASVIAVTALTEAVRDAFGSMVGMIQVMVVAVLVLALLIAFNSASINLEARVREHATMFSFGVRVRTALRMASVESLVVGVAAAALGTVGGLAMVWWITQRVLTKTLPDFGLEVVLTPGTVAMVGAVGILVVAAAPLLTTRKMVRMDLPRTLRLVE